MMDQKKIFKQVIDFNRNAFNNTFNAWTAVQDQAARFSQALLDQAQWLPEENRNTINEWFEAYRKGRNDYKSSVDSGFNQLETFFNANN